MGKSKNISKCPNCDEMTLKKNFILTFNGRAVHYKCTNCSTENSFPVITGKVQKKTPGERVPAIKITCPYCEKVHTHSSAPLPGLRHAHCAPGPIPKHCWPDPAPASRMYWIIPDVVVEVPAK